ncbi:MAG TPA: hypothetical protein VJN95_08830 [Gemmatimonadales bacterium]|nr:hypothetical protein [Gemmatimonadales bacterium]
MSRVPSRNSKLSPEEFEQLRNSSRDRIHENLAKAEDLTGRLVARERLTEQVQRERQR